jgi:hypothetical protein
MSPVDPDVQHRQLDGDRHEEHQYSQMLRVDASNTRRASMPHRRRWYCTISNASEPSVMPSQKM